MRPCVLVLALLTVRCAGPPDEGAAASDWSMAECATTDARAATDYAQSAAWGALEDGLTRLGGIALSDDAVFLYDPLLPGVVVLDTLLKERFRFGREGDGPGEFRTHSVPPRLGGGSWRWIAFENDTLQVYDGRRLSLFSSSGEYLRSPPPGSDTGLGPLNGRVLRSGGTVIFGAGGYDLFRLVEGRAPVLALRRMTDNVARTIHEETLPALPLAGGRPWVHPAQARPMWDVVGECMYFNDGTSGRLTVVHMDLGVAGALTFPVPGVGNSTDNDDQAIRDLTRSMGMPAGMPQPTAPVRIIDMIVDPERRVWLHLRRERSGDRVVLRVSVPGGQVERLEPPAWPRVFGRGGGFYAAEPDDNGIIRISRWEPQF